jgi:hypothetical protein
MPRTMVRMAAALGGVASLVATTRAEAADCSTVTTNPIVYMVGAKNSQPIWTALSKQLPNIGIVFQPGKSCIGLNEVVTGAVDPLPALYMDGTAAGMACTNPGAAMLNDSDVYASSCAQTIPSGFAEFAGPVQTMMFAVPSNSSATSISADAAYTVFGWGGLQYPVSPWTTFTQVFSRPTTAGTIILIGSAIGLAPSKWLSQNGDAGAAQVANTPDNMVTDLRNAAAGATPSAAIGILAADLADSDRGPFSGGADGGTPTGGIKALAFQAAHQDCGYLPDSDSTHFDKINVRQGRYALWGPIHLTTAVDGSGKPTNASVATIVNTIRGTGLTDPQMQTIIGQVDAVAHVVPDCAMEVSRSGEVTPATGAGEASYAPTKACGCYFESQVNGGTPYSKHCKTCSTDADCSSPYGKCNYGYCEAQ